MESLIRQEWAEGLAGIDGQDIGEAIARCRDDTARRPGPPDIAEFRAYCHAARRRREVLGRPETLPAETDREAARVALANILASLRDREGA